MSGHFDDEEPWRLPPADARSQGAQCWICPHCHDDAHHYSDAQGCELHVSKGAEHRIVIGPTDV